MAIVAAFSGGNETQSLVFATSSGGSVAFDGTTTDPGTGGGSFKFDTGAGPTTPFLDYTGLTADAGRRLVMRCKLNNLPTSNYATLIGIKDGSNNKIVNVGLSTGGVLELVTASNTGVAAGTTAIPTGTWFTVTLAYTITSTTVNHFKIYLRIDGTPGVTTEIDASNVTLPFTTGTDLNIGYLNGTQAGANKQLWISSLVIDDNNTLADPGDLRATHKQYVGTSEGSTTNAYDTAVGTANTAFGSRYLAVSELPNNDSNGWSQAATTQKTEKFLIQAANAGNADISAGTLTGWRAWVRAKTAASATTSITDNDVDTSISTTTTITNFFHSTSSSTYPTGRFGVKSTGTTTDSFFYEGGVNMVYTPAASTFPPVPQNQQLSNPVYRM